MKESDHREGLLTKQTLIWGGLLLPRPVEPSLGILCLAGAHLSCQQGCRHHPGMGLPLQGSSVCRTRTQPQLSTLEGALRRTWPMFGVGGRGGKEEGRSSEFIDSSTLKILRYVPFLPTSSGL